MKELNSKKIIQKILKAAAWGAVLFAGFTLAVIIGHNYFGRGTSGQLGPDTFLALESLIGRPADIIINDGSKFGQWLLHQKSDLIIYLVIILINGLLGALAFSIPAFIWQLIMKNDYENKT